MKTTNIDTSTLEGKLTVMQRAKNGEAVCLRANCAGVGYSRSDDPGWNWQYCDYQLVIEPRKIYDLEYKAKSEHNWTSYGLARGLDRLQALITDCKADGMQYRIVEYLERDCE